MKINPMIFEVLVISHNLVLQKYRDRLFKMEKNGWNSYSDIEHPCEQDIIHTAKCLLDFLTEYSEYEGEDESNIIEETLPSEPSTDVSIVGEIVPDLVNPVISED